jgi:hypothetical protein
MAPVNCKLWNKDNMSLAVRCGRAGQIGYKRTAKQLAVPKGTLVRYGKDNIKSPEELVQLNLGRKPILRLHIELKLVKW